MAARHAGVMIAVLLALGACSRQGGTSQQAAAPQPAQPSAAVAPDTAPYHTEMPLSEFMPHVMQYAGDGVWKWQGWKNDASGEHSLFPKSDQDWEEAESGARTLAEVTNLLLLPGRRIAEPAWDDAVAQVYKIALRAADAAERHDTKAFFDAGGDLDEACDVCHVRYDPTFKQAGRANAAKQP